MDISDADTTRAERVYVLLLYAYPCAYRARFGEAMRETFAADRRRVSASGHIAVVLFWIVTVMQAAWFGLAERLGAGGRTSMHGHALHPQGRTRQALSMDVRHGFRLLMRSPVFTMSAVLSLAIGLAAATTTFALADALLFETSPGVREAARVVDIARTTNGGGYGTLSYPLLRYLRAHTQTLDFVSATTMDPIPLSRSTETGSQRVFGRTVSSTYFDALQVRPALGRFFHADEDDTATPHPVAVLSHRFWREHFHADPAALQQPIRLNQVVFTIVGVAEEGFENPTIVGTDLWIPIAMTATVTGQKSGQLFDNPGQTWHRGLGRLKPHVTRATAQAELNTLLEAFRTETRALPASYGIKLHALGRLPPPVRASFGAFAALLISLACGLFAIACSNVTGLLLARATVRRGEMATRLALGASRAQLVRQLLVETLLLFLGAALTALPVTIWLTGSLHTFVPAMPVPMRIDIAVSVRTMLFGVALSIVAGLVFGLVQARHTVGHDLSQALHGRASTAGRTRLRVRQGLVVAQIAVSLAVAIAAGLFVRTLVAAAQIDTGFSTANIDIVSIDTTIAGTTEPKAAAALMTRLADRLRTVKGAVNVAYARMIPLRGGRFDLGGVQIPGLAPDAAARLEESDWDVVSADYFQTVGLPLIDGRAFTRDDRDSRPLVAIVNATFARVAWPGRSGVGQRFWLTTGRGSEARAVVIVGIAKDAKYRSINEASRPFVYVPFDQHPQTRVELFVRHEPGASIARDLRIAMADVEPGLPVITIQSFDAAAALGLVPHRLAAWVAGTVGTVGVFLASIGLYGLAAFLVAQRSREIAIRMSLGATPVDVRALVLRQAARLSLAGTFVGLLMAAALAQSLQNLRLLVNVQPIDPLTFSTLAALMCAVLFAASYLPARKASLTNPASALS